MHTLYKGEISLFDNRYELLALIGRGSFSEVWKARDTLTNVVQALKIYCPNSGMDIDGVKMLTREFSMVCSLNHSNLLRPNSFAIRHGKTPYLVLPYCPRGNTSNIVGRISEIDIWHLIRDIASALNYLHAKNPPIIHQDIKPANILIGDDGEFLLSDFGISIKAILSKSNLDNSGKDLSMSGTVPYMAPERFSRNNRPILANDIYSLGATVFELITGHLPFGDEGGIMLKNGADVPEVTGNFSSLLKKTVESCLIKDPNKRPTASELEIIANKRLNTYKKGGKIKTQDLANSKKAIWTIISTILLIIAFGFSYYYIYPTIRKTEPPSQNSTEKETDYKDFKEEATASVAPDETKSVAIDETKSVVTDESKSVVIKNIKPVATEDVKSVVPEKIEFQGTKENIPVLGKKQVVKKERNSQPSSIDLGYAIWHGPSQNGQPHGYGKMTFKQNHRIDSRDPQNYMAQRGDIVEGDYANGHLVNGTWTNSNGEKILILIGL